MGREVSHLQPLVQVTFEGDTRRGTLAVRQSRIDGPHAELSRLLRDGLSEGEVYARMGVWLRVRYPSDPCRE
jgi:hypothetical protein